MASPSRPISSRQHWATDYRFFATTGVWIVVLLTINQFLRVSFPTAPITTISDTPNVLPASSPFGLVIPQGPAVALPSIRTTTEEEKDINRNIYGGKGDKRHLGGFTSFDPFGVSPTLWKVSIIFNCHMIVNNLICSIIDKFPMLFFAAHGQLHWHQKLIRLGMRERNIYELVHHSWTWVCCLRRGQPRCHYTIPRTKHYKYTE